MDDAVLKKNELSTLDAVKPLRLARGGEFINRINRINRSVSGTEMENAIVIGGCFVEHAKAAYQIMGVDKTTADARYI